MDASSDNMVPQMTDMALSDPQQWIYEMGLLGISMHTQRIYENIRRIVDCFDSDYVDTRPAMTELLIQLDTQIAENPVYCDSTDSEVDTWLDLMHQRNAVSRDLKTLETLETKRVTLERELTVSYNLVTKAIISLALKRLSYFERHPDRMYGPLAWPRILAMFKMTLTTLQNRGSAAELDLLKSIKAVMSQRAFPSHSPDASLIPLKDLEVITEALLFLPYGGKSSSVPSLLSLKTYDAISELLAAQNIRYGNPYAGLVYQDPP